MANKNIIAGPPATFWVRVAAQLLDGMILGSCFFFLGIVMAIAIPQLFKSAGNSHSGEMAGLIVSIVYFGLPCLYFTLSTAIWGQTVGKKVFNLRVARLDGRPVSFLISFWRWFSYFFSAIPLGLGYVLTAITSDKRALHDFTSDTKVVQVGPYNETLMIVLLCVMPIGGVFSLGIFAAIAIPRFAQMLEKSREGATKQNLNALKSAAGNYYGDHYGKWPADLQKDLVPKYIDMIPPVKTTGAFVANAKSPSGNKVTLTSPGRVPRESGEGWLYDPSVGNIFINSTVKDSRSIPYSFYGHE